MGRAGGGLCWPDVNSSLITPNWPNLFTDTWGDQLHLSPTERGSLPPAWKHFCSGAGAGQLTAKLWGKVLRPSPLETQELARACLSSVTVSPPPPPPALGADVTLFKDPGEKRAGASVLCNQAAEAGTRELERPWEEQRAFWERHGG